jgi:dihydrofolate reductase
MGKLVWSTNFTLDGVVQDPDGHEGFERGGWFGEVGGEDLGEWAKIEFNEALGTEALLLGKRSDDWFGSRWNDRSDEWAHRLNSLPKYVVSSTLTDPVWANSTVLSGGAVEEVSKLKQQIDGDIVIYGSYQLGRTLLERQMIDELRLFLFPVALGAGERLFEATTDKRALRLLSDAPVGKQLRLLTFEVLRDAA